MSESERKRDADRKRKERAEVRTVVIPLCADKKRRTRLEKNVFKWLRWYGHEEFTREFTDQQKQMIRAIITAFETGDDQAIAASRGEGKSSIAEWVLMFLMLKGLATFAVLFAATGPDAENSLDSIRDRLEENERLAADYPEVCAPVRALEGAPQRANAQIVVGHRHDNGKAFKPTPSKFRWCGKEIRLPRVPGSPASGAIIATRGLDGAVRGLKRGKERPMIAVIDDPDTEDTVNSEEQAAKLEKKIDTTIAGLAGQKKPLARVILTTIQKRTSVSARFTDPAIKPSFHGKRFKFLEKPPERMDLWEEFIQLQQIDWSEGTKKADAFYAKRQRSMDAGAVLGNPHRTPRGELSALQFFFIEVARLGWDAVNSEYQNDPPEETGPIESGITALHIQRRVNGLARGVIPSGCTALVRGIDCRKAMLHWVIRAFRPDGTGFTIDYGEHLTRGTVQGSEEGIDLALRRAIREVVDSTKERPYRRADGEIVPIKLTLVDSGYRASAIYQACRECGVGIMPAKGYGKSNGCAAPNFSEAQKATKDRTPGDGWFITRVGDPGAQVNLVHMDTDRWKAFEHDRWMTEAGQPGALSIFGQPSENPGFLSHDQKAIWPYARQIVSEVEAEEFRKGMLHRFWKQINPNNHWLDASYMSDCASNICGIKLLQAIEAQQQRLGPAVQMAAMPDDYSGRPLVGASGVRGRRAW